MMIIINVVQFCKRNGMNLLKNIRHGKEVVREIHISGMFVPVLYVLVTISMKLHVCQAKAYCKM
jgi:hypothetical protein